MLQLHAMHWHGPNAKGGRMYVGVHRKQFPDDEIESTVTFQSLGPYFQKQIAEFAHRRKWCDPEEVAELIIQYYCKIQRRAP